MSSLLFYTHKDLSVCCSHLLFHVFYVAVSYCDREKEEREERKRDDECTYTQARFFSSSSPPPLFRYDIQDSRSIK